MQKYAYVSGSDRGLGLALVKVLLSRGYYVFAGSYMPDWPELTELAGREASLQVLSLDVTSDASVADAAQAIRSATGHLDILINNAAIYLNQDGDVFGGIDYDAMMKMYNTNALGPLRVTQSVIELLIKGTDKRLVNISSEAGSIAGNWRKNTYGYCMSKSALNMQGAIMQNHLQEYGIKVMQFQPGWVRSYMSGKLNEEATVEAIDSATGIIGQALSPQDIASHPSYTDYEGKALPW